MTYGFSRDDAGKFLDAYYDAKIFENDPFAKLDTEGVGQLMKMAVEKGKATRPSLHCGICGEHGGDPTSVEFCHEIGSTMFPAHLSVFRLHALLLHRLLSRLRKRKLALVLKPNK